LEHHKDPQSQDMGQMVIQNNDNTKEFRFFRLVIELKEMTTEI